MVHSQVEEEKIYNYWIKKGYFYSIPNDKPSYTIIMPPPNVTGVLHTGHIINNTLQDVLIRRARLQGYNVCWIPGTDHASIATETKISTQLYKENKTKYHLGRDNFIKRSWEWSYKQEFIIYNQLQKLGCSCDWKRTSFTMDQERYRAVINCFVELYKRGLIYKEYRLVNWDNQAKTTISNEEVIYKEQKGSLYYFQYPFVGGKGNIVITTTRPETIFGDIGICIHPNDNRYTILLGKQVIIPIVDRIVPIIKDEYVDKQFGTGVLKITPAHDMNDTILSNVHSLEFIDLFNEDGTINKNGVYFKGKNIPKVRKDIVEVLHKKGLLVKKETYFHRIAISERTNSIIETRRSAQWYLKTKSLAKPALNAVMKGDIRFYPKNFKSIYRHWISNVQDWNISRQLWWGHRIPIYYYGKSLDKCIVASTRKEAEGLLKQKKINIKNIIQDEDVLDTWFSSWIWPISILLGFSIFNTINFLYYYPTKNLITGPDILFFWVARMIMAGLFFKKTKPFDNVYFTGIVRDSQGKKMSKSIGNSPDPIELIEKYGSDGVRMGLLLSAKAGRDLLFKEEFCLQGRNFSNKLWNALNLILKFKLDNNIETPQYSSLAIEWFEHILSNMINHIESYFIKYNISKALNKLYKLIWHDFCSWYLESIKPNSGVMISQFVWGKTLIFLKDILILLHPYMPYITERIWDIITNSRFPESILTNNWPITKNSSYEEEFFNSAKKLVISIRNLRKIYRISFKNSILIISIKKKEKKILKKDSIFLKLANISQIYFLKKKPINYQLSFLIDSQEYFIYFASEKDIKYKEDIKNIQKYIYYIFLIRNKLSNTNYIFNAPLKVVNFERKKFTDILEKIKFLK